MSYERRRRAVLEASDGRPLLVTTPANVRYLTGFTGSNGQLLCAQKPYFFTDGRYKEQSASQVSGCEIVVYRQNTAFLPSLRERIEELSVDEIGIESAHVSVDLHERMRSELEGVGISTTSGVVERLRARKDPPEVDAITRAQRVAEKAVSDVFGSWDGRGTELELALALEWAVRTGGADGMAFEVIVASGSHAALPHARPRPVPIEPGTVLLVDIGARVDGYCSDMTRTWLRDAPEPMPSVHDAVVRALEAACGVVRAGAKCSDVDEAARDVLEAQGHGEAFLHSTGHAVGLDVHEGPRLAKTSEDVLEAGMVLTVEPGVYLPGVGGVRVEDLLVVTEDGHENLTSLPRSSG